MVVGILARTYFLAPSIISHYPLITTFVDIYTCLLFWDTCEYRIPYCAYLGIVECYYFCNIYWSSNQVKMLCYHGHCLFYHSVLKKYPNYVYFRMQIKTNANQFMHLQLLFSSDSIMFSKEMGSSWS